MSTESQHSMGWIVKGFLWLLSLLVAGVIGAAINFYFTERSNLNAVIQQQNSSRIEQFERTGNELDSKFSALSDSVVDKRNIVLSLQELRTAIAQHSATVTGLNSLIGEENSNAYLEMLSTLRQLVDKSKSPESTMVAARLHAQLVAARWRLAEIAKAKISGKDNLN